MKQRLNHTTGEETEEELAMAGEHRTEGKTALEFETPEELLRHDAANTPMPSQIRERVMQSIAQEPPKEIPAPWWKRWMRF